MKRVIVLSTSLRRGSNSDMLADRFVEGALSAGNDVEKVSLVGKDIQFCRGCFACQKLGRCVIKDDVNDIMAKVLEADVVCWATPIYYYEMSGQMKTLIDRLNSMYPLDYKFRDVYLLTTAAEDEEDTPKRAEAGLTGWIAAALAKFLFHIVYYRMISNLRTLIGFISKYSNLVELISVGNSLFEYKQNRICHKAHNQRC